MKNRTMRTVAGINPALAGIAKFALAGIWLVPALAVNLNWEPSGSIPWNLSAAGTVAASAVVFEATRHQKSRLGLTVLVLFGALLFFANVANGFRNAVTRSGDASDHRRGEIESAMREKDMRNRLIAGRLEAVAIAGEASAAQYGAAISERKAADARRWRATQGCDAAGGITLPVSQEFCAGIAVLQGKLEAAQRRDQIDTQLVVIDLRRDRIAPPSSADPFAEAAAGTLSAAGLSVASATVRTFFDGLWSIMPELVAALMPAVTLSIFGGQQGQERTPLPRSRPLARREECATEDTSPLDAEGDPFSRFLSDTFERAPGARLTPGAALNAWQSWNARQGREAESQRWLGLRLGQAVAFEEKHKRKAYLNVRLKQQPRLRLVSGRV